MFKKSVVIMRSAHVLTHLPTRFTADSVSNTTQVRSSKRREVRRKILDMFPTLEADIDVMFPKAVPMYIAKWYTHTSRVTMAVTCAVP